MTRPANPRHSVRWEYQFVLLASIWGASFILIKLANASFDPVQISLGRTGFGAITLLTMLAPRRVPLPRGREVWLHLAVVGLLFNAIPFALFPYGEQRISSVLAGIYNGATPLFTVIAVSLLVPAERPSRRVLLGVGVGFAGILTVFGAWNGGAEQGITGQLACLTAVICYGIALAYGRRYLSGRSESTMSLAAGQLIAATVELLLVTPFTTHVPGHVSASSALAVLSLGVLGTGVAFALTGALVRTAGATTASTVTYVVPIFSTAGGVLILGEHLAWNEPVGALAVLAGAVISRRSVSGTRARRS